MEKSSTRVMAGVADLLVADRENSLTEGPMSRTGYLNTARCSFLLLFALLKSKQSSSEFYLNHTKVYL